MAADLTLIFLSTVLVGFAVTLAVMGLFGAYYGKGKSRTIGFLIALVAVLLFGLFAAWTWPMVPGIQPVFDPHIVAQSMVAVVAALIGTVVAVVAFISTVTRS